MTPATAHPSQRTRQRETTRRRLIQAGLRVVAAEGFAGASTAAIARATGKAHGTVFVHFPTRDALVAELVAEVGRGMSTQLARLAGDDPALPDVLDAHLAALAEHEQLYARVLSEAATLPKAARAQVFALQSGIAFRLRAAWTRARAQGTVRDLDPVALANIWISLTNHYLMNRDLFAPGGSVIENCGAALKSQLLDLIRP
ncbi:MAG: TetR/AcrR family transcriptional regulator [Steroidobacteraceae bacterium]